MIAQVETVCEVGLMMVTCISLMEDCSCAEGLLGETMSRFSIWSLYITFVLAVGRFIRLQCADIRMRIPYENFPACDRCCVEIRLRPLWHSLASNFLSISIGFNVVFML